MLDKPEDVLRVVGVIEPFDGHQPMPAPCKDCPFVKHAEGKGYLTEERFNDIKMSSLLGQPFYCHKSVYRPGVEMVEDPESGFTEPPPFSREYRQCRGALDWARAFQKEHGK